MLLESDCTQPCKYIHIVVKCGPDSTAHLCTGAIHENYKLFVNPLFMSSRTQPPG